MGKNTDQLGLEQLEKERFRIITDIIYYAAGHVDRMDFKYGCTLNRLVFKVRECIDIYDLAEVIQEDMLNTYSIVTGLVSDKYLMNKKGSTGKYDCIVTKKGKKIGMGRYTTSEGVTKITLSSAAADMVIRNIRNGRYLNRHTEMENDDMENGDKVCK